ncbi:MAG: hypothetical protein J0L86_05560 [Flavobacteriales bacterium]|nr:hypothetical protein [Flavobacteriales bacterium]
MNLYRVIVLILLIGINNTIIGQETKKVPTIKPKIMVIPKTPEGVSIIEYSQNLNIQSAITKINDVLLSKEANLISFNQSLKEFKQNNNINIESGNSKSATDYKSKILQQSKADIYIEFKTELITHKERNAKSINIILDAYQVGTSNIIANKIAFGPMFQTEDVNQLITLAIEKVAEEFLNQLQQKFDDLLINGQSVFVEFTCANESKFNLDSEINGTMLSELLNEWFEKNAYNGVFNNQGASTLQNIFSDVRIPLKNPNNPNANYTGQNLAIELSKYLKSIGVPFKREISTNNKILITIL